MLETMLLRACQSCDMGWRDPAPLRPLSEPGSSAADVENAFRRIGKPVRGGGEKTMNLAKFNPATASLFEKVRWGEQLGAFDRKLGAAVRRAVLLGVEDQVVTRLVDDIIRPYVK